MDPDGREGLVAYYRQFSRFGVKEHFIAKSKWFGFRPEHVFYKAEDPDAEKIILDTLSKADAESP